MTQSMSNEAESVDLNDGFKGDCYEASVVGATELLELKRLVEAGEADVEAQQFYSIHNLDKMIEVVQGEVTAPNGPHEGRTFKHSWIEVGDAVFETTNGQREKREAAEYYALYNATPLHRYAVDEALQLVRKIGGYVYFADHTG